MKFSLKCLSVYTFFKSSLFVFNTSFMKVFTGLLIYFQKILKTDLWPDMKGQWPTTHPKEKNITSSFIDWLFSMSWYLDDDMSDEVIFFTFLLIYWNDPSWSIKWIKYLNRDLTQNQCQKMCYFTRYVLLMSLTLPPGTLRETILVIFDQIISFSVHIQLLAVSHVCLKVMLKN